ncbi:hypothetical protein CC1G_12088 [Coprinopsis cinerea okayama7|uniref:N-acetyltransferase domain-containing protein n=1 Tax=Coprinopsis cinerea (strain Okayama-7 / 130 / ATCC MYA-4618 / FGSC 9003) TaxID=240176 RepID=A8N5Q6_COPC7|nr:hypothetical protein CC1G_12088 [Coprinopsis cinerea okayama7\|eukprot:XP_001830201.1 hypothetical protein CC1G_12088 [Coprinopsis cinerea okayama7\
MSSETLSPVSAPTTLYSPDKQIRLTPPTCAEDEQVSVLRSDPIVRRYLRFMPPITVPEVTQRRLTRSQDPRILDYNVFLGDTTELIGMTGVFNIDTLQKSCEAGIVMASNVQGKGLSTKVFYTLLKDVFEMRGFHRVTFETGEDNAPMRGWLEKVAGARLEGKRIEAWVDSVNGGRTNVCSYAILEWEWRGKVKDALEKKMGIVSH